MTTVQLELEGMTCASCAARIEKKLNRVEGVEATVNLAAERATVVCDPDVPEERLIAAVEAAGYGARVAGGAHEHDAPGSTLIRRLVVGAALSAPVAVVAMVPPLQFAGWEWAALALATPVVLWAGAGFHRAAVRAARHGTTTMDTLVSLGTLAAWSWSAVVLVAGLETDTYFEVATVITTVILLGRYLEGRARTRSSDAIRKLAAPARLQDRASVMEHGYDKGAIAKRLHRIEGQVRGIERMVDDGRYCIDVLTQISAVSKALDALALEILDEHVRHCVAGAVASGDEGAAAAKAEELLAAVGRFARAR